jgi:hypothetical protein
MDEVLKDDRYKGTPLDGMLKGLQGKNLSKKGIFDFLANINLEELYGKKENVIYAETGLAIEKSAHKPQEPEEKEPEEIKCKACQKSFTVQASLRRHLERSTVCVNWNNLPQKIDGAKLTKGIHLLIDEMLDKAIGNGTDFECKHCKTKFTTKGNHHKHFNSASVCNRLAFQEFKALLNNL